MVWGEGNRKNVRIWGERGQGNWKENLQFDRWLGESRKWGNLKVPRVYVSASVTETNLQICF